jgi:Flp pilus assembly pilin Flp
MTQMMTVIGRLFLRDDGQDLLEYALLVGLVALVAMVGITTVGNTVFTVFWTGIGTAV